LILKLLWAIAIAGEIMIDCEGKEKKCVVRQKSYQASPMRDIISFCF
jgi:hypothetical protein